MTNQATINGQDIWLTYKANLIKGAYDVLRKIPPAKELIKNESRLEQGVRVIEPTDGLKFQSQELSIPFLIEGKTSIELESNCQSFIAAITAESIKFGVRKLGYEYTLIYQEMTIKNYSNNYRQLTVKFLEPNPGFRIRTFEVLSDSGGVILTR